MPNEARIPGLGLTTTELKSIDSYRKKKNTAVLTIMFTDIQGFTSLTEERGESYMHELHSEHDRIVVDCVEKGRAGIVIKYIGDAVMAIFSEPTAAVERALLIQRKLAEFNKAHPDLDDIKVRIGLHMGQTVIENKMHIDLFGRHVNKASRVEGLADGGQVYISYPAFDSVRSWLIEADHAGFKHHGSYYLKGIRKPEDVYEVYNTDLTQPRPPRKGRKAGTRRKVIALAAAGVFLPLLVIGTVLLARTIPKPAEREEGAASANRTASQMAEPATGAESGQSEAGTVSVKEKTGTGGSASGTKGESLAPKQAVEEVLFVDLYAEEPILDRNTRLVTTAVEGTRDTRKALTEIGAGHHVIHFVVSDLVLYHTEFDVKPGKNLIPLTFERSELPDIQINLFLEDTEEDRENRVDKKQFAVFEKESLKRIDYAGVLQLDVSGIKLSEDLTRFTITYSLRINEEEKVTKTLTVDSPMEQEELQRSEPMVIWEDPYQRYILQFHYRNEAIQVNIGGSFKDV